MRIPVVLVAMIAVSTPVRADTIVELEARGELAAKDGRYSEAITAFKAADQIESRAKHACLIALAYLRRELWPQAEIFLDACHQRASATDLLPDWVPLATDQLAERLASAEVAPITISVIPASARVTVSAFAPDEQFEPRTIHLGFGKHVITASAEGYVTEQRSIDVIDRKPQTIAIELRAPPKSEIPPPPPREAHYMPWLVIGSGGAVLVAGLVYQLTVFQPIRDHVLHAVDPAHDPNVAEYNQYAHRYDVRREWMLGIYSVGAATIITGCVLRYLDHRDERRVQITAIPTRDGGIVSFEWHR
ncbi:MAG: hypothetical protein JWO36_112 [Myxococcales bacterium]|nr:hypothetical protein [Myxococcales bacterium]